MNAASETARGTLLKSAVEYYHSLLEDHELAAESHRVLHEGLEKNRLIFGGRPLSPGPSSCNPGSSHCSALP